MLPSLLMNKSLYCILQVLFWHVLSGEITVDRLVRMTPEQLASPELATWREQETKHVSIPYLNNLFRKMAVFILEYTLGSLNNDDCDGNGNAAKQQV